MVDGVYFVLADAKLDLVIDTGDTADDSLLTDYGDKANRKVDNDVSRYLNSIPLSPTSAVTEDLREAALLWSTMLYQIHRHNYESADHKKSLYKEVIDGVKTRFRAIPSNRTNFSAATKAYATEPLASDPLLDT